MCAACSDTGMLAHAACFDTCWCAQLYQMVLCELHNNCHRTAKKCKRTAKTRRRFRGLQPPTSNLLGRIAMLSGGGMGSPNTDAVRQLSAGMYNSATYTAHTAITSCALLSAADSPQGVPHEQADRQSRICCGVVQCVKLACSSV